MATKSTKPVTRETSAIVHERGYRPLIATIHGSMFLIRPKGMHREEVLDIAAAWSMAVKQRVAREKADRKAARRTQ